MAQPTTNLIRSFRMGEFNAHPVLASTKIVEGAAVGEQISSGYARHLTATTDLDRFLGFAQEEADNTSGANGAINVSVRRKGEVLLAITGVDGVDDIGKGVYASEGNTFTVTSADDTVYIGRIVQHVSGTSAWVAFDTTNSLHVTHLADVAGGATVDAEARTAINSLKNTLVDVGIMRAGT